MPSNYEVMRQLFDVQPGIFKYGPTLIEMGLGPNMPGMEHIMDYGECSKICVSLK